MQSYVAMLGSSNMIVNHSHSDAEFVHPFGVSISNRKHSIWHTSNTKSFLPHVYYTLHYPHYLEKSQPGSGDIGLKPQHLGSRGREISAFEASLVYIASSRIAKDTQRNPVSKNNKKKNRRENRQTDFSSWGPPAPPPNSEDRSLKCQLNACKSLKSEYNATSTLKAWNILMTITKCSINKKH